MLLEPETKYKVKSVEENKPGFAGITWITVKVIEPSQIIEGLTKRVKAAKEGKKKMILIFLSFYFYREDEVSRMACGTDKHEHALL